MRKFYWWVFILWHSFRHMFQINLGDKVWYKDKIYLVRNGVPRHQWRLAGLNSIDDGYVFRCECRKVRSLQNCIHSFKFMYGFYMTAWYDIWCRNGIEPWMRGCNIW